MIDRMKNLTGFSRSILVLTLLGAASSVIAQSRDTRPADPARTGANRQDRVERDSSPRPSMLMLVLDTDKDGELSAREIENAAAALKKLDRNKDGKLSKDELLPPSVVRERKRRDRPSGPSPEEMVSRMMVFDKNKDGQLTKDELPERIWNVFSRLDENHDGIVTKEELTQQAEKEAASRKARDRRDAPAGR